MRIILIAILLILVVVVLIAGIRNKFRISFLSIVVLLIPAVALGYFEWAWQDAQTQISKTVVAKITENRKSELKCQRLSEGFFDVWASEKLIEVPENMVGLKYKVCGEILDYYKADPEAKPKPTLAQLEAMQLLSEESVKLANPDLKPAEAKCLGIKNIPLVVEALGGSPSQGQYGYLLYKQEKADKDPELRGFTC